MTTQITLPTLTSIDDILGHLLNRDPMNFVENFRTVKGEPFKIIDTGRDYLEGVYHYICWESWKPGGKPVVVVKGRQVEFTETMLNICLYFLYHFHNINILYAFPAGNQVRIFSSDRFDGAIRTSQNGSLKNLFLHGGKQNVHHKQFKTNSQIFLHSAWGQADSLRSIMCDVLVKDEIQDWTTAGIQNTRQALTQSKYKIDLSLGTPKSEGTHYHKIWEESDKRHFHVCCTNCSEFFRITLELLKTGTIVECPNCKKLQEKKHAVKKGKWVPLGKNPDSCLYTGFHLSQLLHPNITTEQILREKKTISEVKFKNEILGEFTGSLTRPLSPQDIVEMVEQEGWNNPEWAYPLTLRYPEETVMGIDWGGHSEDKPSGSFNAVVIVKPLSYAKYQIVYSEKVMYADYKKQIEQITNLAYRYNTQQIVADQGYGHVQIQMLREEFGEKVVACTYMSQLKTPYRYDPELRAVSVDKDYALEELYKEIHDKQWIIPLMGEVSFASAPDEAEGDQYEWLIHHICNIEIVDVTRGGNVRKSFQKTKRPCDGLHALNYTRMALIIKGHIIRQQSISIGNYAPMPVLARFGRRF